MSIPFPLFVKLAGRDVLVVGGGAMALQRGRQLAEAGARLTVVAPEVHGELAALAHEVRLRRFRPADLAGAWLAIAAATAEVNAEVLRAGDARRVLVNAIDDPAHASAYTGAVVRRGDVTVAVSTAGRAPALAPLVRDAVDAALPQDLGDWVEQAASLRAAWKRDGVPLAERRTRLLEALNERYARPSTPPPLRGGSAQDERVDADEARTAASPAVRAEPVEARTAASPAVRAEPVEARTAARAGFVSLVGAGPGDPALLTRRAAERLAEADLVLYDALASPEALALAPRAHAFYVGKRAGRPSVRQETIHRMLVAAARRGKRVVRLKAGDPFVLGRGREEALALEEAGIPYEVVPGISSALAAPALSGIPVTHRGLATGFAVVSGHAGRGWRPALESLAPGAVTVVVLMGLAARDAIAATLVARGWAPETPAAILLAAGTPRAFTWIGRLDELGAASLPDADAAGTLVVGPVAALGRATPADALSSPDVAIAADAG